MKWLWYRSHQALWRQQKVKNAMFGGYVEDFVQPSSTWSSADCQGQMWTMFGPNNRNISCFPTTTPKPRAGHTGPRISGLTEVLVELPLSFDRFEALLTRLRAFNGFSFHCFVQPLDVLGMTDSQLTTLTSFWQTHQIPIINPHILQVYLLIKWRWTLVSKYFWTLVHNWANMNRLSFISNSVQLIHPKTFFHFLRPTLYE